MRKEGEKNNQWLLITLQFVVVVANLKEKSIFLLTVFSPQRGYSALLSVVCQLWALALIFLVLVRVNNINFGKPARNIALKIP